MRKYILILLGMLACWKPLCAQTFEIRAVEKSIGTVAVEMRVTAGAVPVATDYYTDLVFGLKWDGATSIQFNGDIVTSFNIRKAGSRITRNGFHFQAFAADPVGFVQATGWTSGVWVEIMRIANGNSGAGTTTVAVCEPGFDSTADPNLAVNFTDHTPIINGAAVNMKFPYILAFDVQPAQPYIRISWTSSSEQNNRGFEIQRSLSEAGPFSAIGFVNANTTPGNYTFNDSNATPGIRYYYRLRQVSIADQSEFSGVLAAQLSGDGNEPFKLQPNPAQSFIELTAMDNSIQGKMRLRIVGAKGDIAWEQDAVLVQGQRLRIGVRTLAAGRYHLVIEQAGNILFRTSFLKL